MDAVKRLRTHEAASSRDRRPNQMLHLQLAVAALQASQQVFQRWPQTHMLGRGLFGGLKIALLEAIQTEAARLTAVVEDFAMIFLKK